MEIFLFALSVMYSPGPVNILGFNAGLTGQLKKTTDFFIGVGLALFIYFMLFGYLGEALIPTRYLPYISMVGVIYTFYLGVKILLSHASLDNGGDEHGGKILSFRDGLLIQALNPKSLLVVLPITTIMFPAAHINGVMIFLISVLLGIGGGGAPGSYSLMGAVIGGKITNKIYIHRFNQLMGILLIIVAVIMLCELIAPYY